MTTVSTTYPLNHVGSILHALGWPKKKGLIFKSEVVDKFALARAVESLVRVGIVLGTGKPEVALRLLADVFYGREWTSDHVTGIFHDFDPKPLLLCNPSPQPWQPNSPPPADFVIADLPFGLVQGEELIPWPEIAAPAYQEIYSKSFLRGLVWGLAYPDEARNRYDADRDQALKDAAAAGVELGGVGMAATFDERLAEHEKFVAQFEAEQRRLSDIPEIFYSLPVIARRMGRAVPPEPPEPAEREEAWWLYDPGTRMNHCVPTIPILALIISGFLKRDSIVRRDGTDVWIKADDDPGLAELRSKSSAANK